MRLFVCETDPDKNGKIVVDGDSFKHFRAIRAEVGDIVRVRLLSGEEAQSTISILDKKNQRLILQLCATSPSAGEGNALKEIWLFQFVPKSTKFDQIVRQATECGVLRIFPVVSEFSRDGAQRTDFRFERFERIIREAIQQSGSSVKTRVEHSVCVNDVCKIWQDEIQKNDGREKRALVFWEKNEKTVPLSSQLDKKIDLCAIAVGSEGGISNAEIDSLCNAGFVPVHLKTNILRCETAALYALGIVQNAIEL